MTEQLAVATTRLAVLTSVIRTRKDDGLRRVLNAGTPRDLNARAELAILRLEKVAEKLEKAIS